MLNEDEFGESLRESLHDLSSGINPSFELLNRIASITSQKPVRSARRRLVAPIGALAAVAIVITVVSVILAGATAPMARAVTIIIGNQLVHLSVGDLEAIRPANEKLSSLGHVRVVRMSAACRTPINDLQYSEIDEHPTPRIDVGDPPARSDLTEILSVRQIGRGRLMYAIGTVKGATPSCVSSHGTGPGLPGWHLHR